MTKDAQKWWIGGAVVLFLIALITWVGTRSEPAITSDRVVTVGTSVQVVAPPSSARASAPTPLSWSVGGPVGKAATHTAIHWGPVSRPGPLGTDITPAASEYPNLLPDYAGGSYALPRSFSSVIIFPVRGTSYYRAHAIIDGKHHWSPEYVIRVE